MISFLKKEDDCKPCKNKRFAQEKKTSIGLFAGILLILLPKCPFCFMAFSCTLMLCGQGGASGSSRTFYSPLTLYSTAFFCLLILFSIFFNYRDARTRYALLAAAIGILLLMVSVAVGGGPILYYLGVVIVFGAVWLNGSLLSLAGKIRHGLFKQKNHNNDRSIF